jgi:hypothetical protein
MCAEKSTQVIWEQWKSIAIAAHQNKLTVEETKEVVRNANDHQPLLNGISERREATRRKSPAPDGSASAEREMVGDLAKFLIRVGKEYDASPAHVTTVETVRESQLQLV